MGKRTREKFSPMEENRAESSLQTLNDFVPHCYRSGLIEIMALRGCPALDSDPQSIMLDLAFLILIQHGILSLLSTMQFIAIALFAAAASAATVTEVDTQSTLVTVTDCASTVTDCPAHSTSAAPNTTAPANVTSFEAGAARNQYAAAGAAALAAGALLAL
ncbi:hypothetical protein QFC19_002357 [Naganishia cerealis]|uniref:Uncharacterized protein n=1 Tax=Naganishia cerealis TaxID=610337 RepID=A0ACC2WAA5_9TREE|nr:hypothetical protein QFC19_002357 [Naganishia cerealis]